MPVGVCGTVVLPSEDTNTPSTPLAPTKLMIAVERALADVEASGRMLLMPRDFGIVERKRPFTPSELATPLGCCPRTVTRLVDDGMMLALPLRENGEPRIPYIGVVYFFLKQQGAMN